MDWKIIRNFAPRNGRVCSSVSDYELKDMAKPIEPTPVLKGDDAYEFVAEMEKQQKASAEEKARVAKGASFIQSLLTFTF